MKYLLLIQVVKPSNDDLPKSVTATAGWLYWKFQIQGGNSSPLPFPGAVNSPVGGLNHRQLPSTPLCRIPARVCCWDMQCSQPYWKKFGLQISFLPTLKYHFLLRVRIQKHRHFNVIIAQAGSELHAGATEPASENQYFQFTVKSKHGFLTTLEL